MLEFQTAAAAREAKGGYDDTDVLTSFKIDGFVFTPLRPAESVLLDYIVTVTRVNDDMPDAEKAAVVGVAREFITKLLPEDQRAQWTAAYADKGLFQAQLSAIIAEVVEKASAVPLDPGSTTSERGRSSTGSKSRRPASVSPAVR